MTRTHAWSPTEGPGAAPQQLPDRCSSHYSGDGDTERSHGGLWAPSEGPYRSDPGGPGGEPDGHTISKPGLNALNEGDGD
jgi:hypothetical protein